MHWLCMQGHRAAPFPAVLFPVPHFLFPLSSFLFPLSRLTNIQKHFFSHPAFVLKALLTEPNNLSVLTDVMKASLHLFTLVQPNRAYV